MRLFVCAAGGLNSEVRPWLVEIGGGAQESLALIHGRVNLIQILVTNLRNRRRPPVLQLRETGSRENATNFTQFHPQLLKSRR